MAKTDAELAKAHRERKKAALGAEWQKQETKKVNKYYIKSADLPKRKLKLRREKIITNLRKCRLRQAKKKEEEITCLTSKPTRRHKTPQNKLVVTFPKSGSSGTRKRASRAVAKGYRKIEKLEKQIQKLNKKSDSMRKRCERLKVNIVELLNLQGEN